MPGRSWPRRPSRLDVETLPVEAVSCGPRGGQRTSPVVAAPAWRSPQSWPSGRRPTLCGCPDGRGSLPGRTYRASSRCHPQGWGGVAGLGQRLDQSWTRWEGLPSDRVAGCPRGGRGPWARPRGWRCSRTAGFDASSTTRCPIPTCRRSAGSRAGPGWAPARDWPASILVGPPPCCPMHPSSPSPRRSGWSVGRLPGPAVGGGGRTRVAGQRGCAWVALPAG